MTAAPSGPTGQSAIRQVAHKMPVPERPRIVTPQKRLQCVPYAREHSKIEIRGDAWTWWNQAKGRYQRGRVPAVGAVLVLRRKGDSRGHLAVVGQIVSDREVIANHANWLNQGRIHQGTPVQDVSFLGNWSAVKVWYTPGNHYGGQAYAAHGFIHPKLTAAR
jgi:surface antigen